jgi:hypothetical protein
MLGGLYLVARRDRPRWLEAARSMVRRAASDRKNNNNDNGLSPFLDAIFEFSLLSHRPVCGVVQNYSRPLDLSSPRTLACRIGNGRLINIMETLLQFLVQREPATVSRPHGRCRRRLLRRKRLLISDA